MYQRLFAKSYNIIIFFCFIDEINTRITFHQWYIVSLSKRHLLPKSTGNTQEQEALSQHD